MDERIVPADAPPGVPPAPPVNPAPPAIGPAMPGQPAMPAMPAGPPVPPLVTPANPGNNPNPFGAVGGGVMALDPKASTVLEIGFGIYLATSGDGKQNGLYFPYPYDYHVTIGVLFPAQNEGGVWGYRVDYSIGPK